MIRNFGLTIKHQMVLWEKIFLCLLAEETKRQILWRGTSRDSSLFPWMTAYGGLQIPLSVALVKQQKVGSLWFLCHLVKRSSIPQRNIYLSLCWGEKYLGEGSTKYITLTKRLKQFFPTIWCRVASTGPTCSDCCILK